MSLYQLCYSHYRELLYRELVESDLRSFALIAIIQCKSHGTNSSDDRLYLSPYITNGSAAVARKLSKVNSTLLLGVKSHAGFITVKPEFNNNLFFWFFPVKDMASKPWVVWLEGGPGYSSILGLFDLIGPIKIRHGKVKHRNVTWASDYSLLFVDSPVGAGFSFTDDDRGYPDSEEDVGSQLYNFLQQFLEMFPELRKAPLFVCGQSYGGKYVPSLSIHIHRSRDKKHPINFKGLAIGNAVVDPRHQMHYTDLCRALGMLDTEELEALQALEDDVVKLIDAERFVDASNKFNETIEYIKKISEINIFNFGKDPSDAPYPFEAFVNRPEVREIIHVGDAAYNLDNQLVYQKMLPDIMRSVKPWVEELLEHYGVLSYSGQLDVIVPYVGSKQFYKELRWSRRQEYEKAPRMKLKRLGSDSVVGYKKSGGNSHEVLIRKAGHHSPGDQPEVVKFMIDSFFDEYK